MYESFYGLRERPFDLTPNPRFLFLTARHREALSTLHYGLSAHRGLTLLLGDAGTGKTTLVKAALATEEKHRNRYVLLNNPTLTRAEFYEFLANGFEFSDDAARSKTRFLAELHKDAQQRLAAGGVTALIIDEAQSLPHELLEEVRLLANMETATTKLVNVVLVGQPELADRLNDASLRQLKQRITLRCELAPLDLRESLSYIAVRLRVAGGVAGDVFTREAVISIFEASSGLPRTISVLCDNALLTGFAAQRKPVDKSIVEEVVRDFAVGNGNGSGPTERVVAAKPEAPALAVVGGRDRQAAESDSDEPMPIFREVHEAAPILVFLEARGLQPARQLSVRAIVCAEARSTRAMSLRGSRSERAIACAAVVSTRAIACAVLGATMSRIDEALRRAARGNAEADASQRPVPVDPTRTAVDDGAPPPWDVPGEPAEPPSREQPAPVQRGIEARPPVQEPDPPIPAGRATMALFRGFHPASAERLVAGPEANRVLTERYRQLAATLHHAQVAQKINIVMVASAVAGEGKTLTATNLALTLSESFKRRVLLIDADLRRPSLHEVFQVPNVSGLNEGLQAPTERKLSLLQISAGLSLLPAGRPDPDPMSSLTSARMRQILEEASSGFAAQAIQNGATDYLIKTGGYLMTIPALIKKTLDAQKLKLSIQRSLQALRESEARYRAIVEDYQTELICRFKPNGALTFVNEVTCRYS